MIKNKIQKIQSQIARTREVTGEGYTPAACKQDALAKAIQELCGIYMEGVHSNSLETNTVTKTTQKANKESSSTYSREANHYSSQDVAQYLGELSSFVEISAPRKRADGMFVGKYRAVKK